MKIDMLKRFMWWVIGVAITSSVNAENLNIKINWEEPSLLDDSVEQVWLPRFADIGYYDAETSLPWSSQSIDLSADDNSEYDIKIISEKLELLDDALLFNLPDSITKSRLIWETNNAFVINRLHIRYLPFVKKDGVWYKVSEVVLSYVPKPLPIAARTTYYDSFKTESVLSTGKFIKLRVSKTGLYKLTYSDIKSMGLQPENVHVYGFGGKELSATFFSRVADDLPEVPVWVSGSDSVFSAGDYLLFYAQGPVSWNYNSAGYFEHNINDFSKYSYYFISSNSNPINQIVKSNTLDNSLITSTVDTYNDYDFVEEEVVSLANSGKDWFGAAMSPGTTRDYSWEFPGLVANSLVRVYFTGVSQSFSTSTNFFTTSFNNNVLGNSSLSSIKNAVDSPAGNRARQTYYSTVTSGDKCDVSVKYSSSNSAAKGFVDYVTVNVERTLSLLNSQCSFRSIKSIGSSNVTQFSIEAPSKNVVVLNITDLFNITEIPVSTSSDKALFVDKTSYLKEYVAFDTKGTIPSPEIIGEVANQNLHGSGPWDMVIVVREKLKAQAERLAQLHRDIDGLRVMVVQPEVIYNEFSSGMPDITAIRWFVKMLRDRYSEEDQIKHLLLFGDGSYNNREDNMANNALLLTCQSKESLNKGVTFVSDDYYALLDNNEGESDDLGIVDIGVGRLPINTVKEATQLVDKIEHYMKGSSTEDWVNKVVFIGDDEDGNLHMNDAEQLAQVVERMHPEFMVKRIFMDAYKQEVGSTGEAYPQVEREINQAISKGVLVMSYSGHGGPSGLSQERVITSESIAKWNNYDKLPLLLTATCDFSPYDWDYLVSAGEIAIKSPFGGGIALFTTTRLVYSHSNLAISKSFFTNVFEQPEGKPLTLGAVYCKTKQGAQTGVNGRKFALIGDPALVIKYPEKKNISILNINGKSDIALDTISALGNVTVSGAIVNSDGTVDTEANGIVYPTFFDKVVDRKTLSNDGDPVMAFKSWENVLYTGKAIVKNGKFNYSFYAPKDLNYVYGNGRIYHYFAGEKSNAHHVAKNITIGGVSDNVIADVTGPLVNAYLNSDQFISGQIVNQESYFIANISDQFGVNASGIGLGHDITLVIDNDPNQMYTLNSFYESSLGSSSEGRVVYKLPWLAPGEHKLSFKVWDVYNNSTVIQFSFIVSDDKAPVINKCLVYPNPSIDYVSFELSHDRPNEVIEVLLEIYNMTGAVIASRTENLTTGNSVLVYNYDLTKDSGVKLVQGIYLYRLSYKSRGVESDFVSGRLIVIP